MMMVDDAFLCLFEYCIAIFLVMPGKPSLRCLDSMSAYGIGRALLEKRLEVPASNRKHLYVDFKGLGFHLMLITRSRKLTKR